MPPSERETGMRRREFLGAAEWRGTRMAALGARAAGRADAAHRRADGLCRERPGSAGLASRRSARTPETWVDRGPQRPNRHSLGDRRQGSAYNASRKNSSRCSLIVIVSPTTPATAALLQQTRTIPIIFAIVADPVGSGFVASFPRPGGNATGFINYEPTIASKWLELLKEIAPRVNQVAFLFNPATAPHFEYYLAPSKLPLRPSAWRRSPHRFAAHPNSNAVIAAQARAPNGGLMVMPDSFTTSRRVEIISLAARYRLPVIYPYREFRRGRWPAVLRA